MGIPLLSDVEADSRSIIVQRSRNGCGNAIRPISTAACNICEGFPMVKFVYVKTVAQNNSLAQDMPMCGQESRLAARAS
jgi:hypothetical protein